MKKFSAAEIIKLITKCRRNNMTMPRGDYSNVTDFAGGITFATGCVFGANTVFGSSTTFGLSCRFGPKTTFGHFAVFGNDVTIGEYSKFLGAAYFGRGALISNHVAFHGSKTDLGVNVSVGRGVVFDFPPQMGAEADFGGGCKMVIITECGEHHTVTLKPHKYRLFNTSRGSPHMSITGVGSEGRTTHFYNTTSGIYVKSGCFMGTLQEFRDRVKNTTMSPNSVKRLQYLGIANIACATWGYNDLIE